MLFLDDLEANMEIETNEDMSEWNIYIESVSGEPLSKSEVLAIIIDQLNLETSDDTLLN